MATDPAAVPAATQAPNSPDIALKLPRDLSPWGMFMSADIVVQAVMVGLAFASVVTWTVWLAKTIELMVARRRMRAAIEALGHAQSWSDANVRTKGRDAASPPCFAPPMPSCAVGRCACRRPASRSASPRGWSASRRPPAAHMIRGTGVLATIGATAPFVGLFGTVWGIMNSFIGISKAQTTNLAVVAPGIAEALLATAIGLVAAIPAVVIYNQFARSIAGYRALRRRRLRRGAAARHPRSRSRA